MTNPSDPGHPPRPPEHGGGPGGPYGPPPPPPPPPPQQTGPIPGPRTPGPSQGTPDEHPEHQGAWTPPPRDTAGKGVLGMLFDMNFDHMITPRLIKITYPLALVPITLGVLMLAWYGLAYIGRDHTVIGLAMLIAAPLLWIFQVLAMRIFMEFVINQFKVTEYLRAIKDKD